MCWEVTTIPFSAVTGSRVNATAVEKLIENASANRTVSRVIFMGSSSSSAGSTLRCENHIKARAYFPISRASISSRFDAASSLPVNWSSTAFVSACAAFRASRNPSICSSSASILADRFGQAVGHHQPRHHQHADVADIADVLLHALHFRVEQFRQFVEMVFLTLRTLHRVGAAIHLDDHMRHGSLSPLFEWRTARMRDMATSILPAAFLLVFTSSVAFERTRSSSWASRTSVAAQSFGFALECLDAASARPLSER
jgi:hypothetical protein